VLISCEGEIEGNKFQSVIKQYQYIMLQFIINKTIADICSGPGFDHPVVSQALFGENCTVLEQKGSWLKIEQWDGYRGWVHEFYGIFKRSKYDNNYFIRNLFATIVSSEKHVMHRLVFGCQLKMIQDDPEKIIEMPDGSTAWLYEELNSFNKDIDKRKQIILCAEMFKGLPYRWGGKSSLGFDCSGLVQTVFLSFGMKIPRDAWQQFDFFTEKDVQIKDLLPGDLIFFAEDQKITHVGISTGGYEFIHSQGEVKKNSLNHDHELFNKKLSEMNVSGKSINSLLETL